VTEATAAADGFVRWRTAGGRWLILATVLGSGVVFLDSTSSHVALPAIAADLGADVAGLQWTINAYTLALASLTLLGGLLGDRFGRRRLFVAGTVWFAAGSLLCGLAPTLTWLVVARALQGVGGALLTPASLALLQTAFPPGERARAVGAWTALSGIGAAAGPLVGGWLVDTWSWRWIFLTNLPVTVVVVAVALRRAPETRDPSAPPRLDLTGALLATLGLGLLTWTLIGAGQDGWTPRAVVAGLAGILALAAFLVVEQRSAHPLLPLVMFASRQFVGANLVTALVYAALSGLLFLLFLQLQTVAGYSAAQAGAAAIPLTGLLLLLSTPAGALAERVGPRWPMTLGPLTSAAGLLLMTRIGAGADYLTTVLPAVTVFGVGLALTVAPLTATVLAAVEERHVGAASGVNNAIARTAGLLAVAALPVLAGIRGAAVADPALLGPGFVTAMRLCAALAAAGGVVGWVTIRTRLADGSPACPVSRLQRRWHCPVGAPPLERPAVGPPDATASPSSRAPPRP
jgi:EmrB/QacA subfamily drug resistance transporter